MWKHFTEIKVENETKTKCNHCTCTFSSSSSTTTLKRHLESEHKEIELEIPKKKRKKEPLEIDLHGKITNDLLEWIVDDNQPFSVVENRIFIRMFEILEFIF